MVPAILPMNRILNVLCVRVHVRAVVAVRTCWHGRSDWRGGPLLSCAVGWLPFGTRIRRRRFSSRRRPL